MTILNSIRIAFLAALMASAMELAALPSLAFAQQPTGAGTPTSGPRPEADKPSTPPSPAPATVTKPAAAPKATLADFAWLAGRWQGTWGQRVAQQVWTAPKAGVMMGTFQLTENHKTLVLELFTVVEDPDGIKLHLRHFTPSLVAWEKLGPTVLDLASFDPNTVVFENPLDGQPKRTIITRIDPDTYVSRSEVVPDKGELQVTEITYRRQKDAPPPRR